MRSSVLLTSTGIPQDLQADMHHLSKLVVCNSGQRVRPLGTSKNCEFNAGELNNDATNGAEWNYNMEYETLCGTHKNT